MRLHDLGLLPVSELHHLCDWGIWNGTFSSHQILSWDEWRVGDMLGEHNLVEFLSEIYIFDLRKLFDIVEI
jgi:hypothetical protein